MYFHKAHVKPGAKTYQIIGIDYSNLAYSTLNEFAAVSANSVSVLSAYSAKADHVQGHNGTSGGAFFHNPDVVADFVWRS